VAVWLSAGNEFVLSAAVWALGFTGFSDIEEDAGMRIPGGRFIGRAM
jgi:hypothetical protein